MNNTCDEKNQILLISSFVSEPIEPYLVTLLEPFSLSIKFAPYNQLQVQLLNPLSELNNSDFYLNILLFRPDDFLKYSNLDTNIEKHLEGLMNEFVSLLDSYLAKSEKKIILVLCPGDYYKNSYLQLFDDCDFHKNLEIIDLRELSNTFNLSSIYDEERNTIAHVPFTEIAFSGIAYLIARRVFSESFIPKKCLVLDCDNTLWHGVVGEDGAQGVSPRVDVQNFMVEQMNKGKMLCLASKNEENDVWAVFENFPAMPLNKEMIVSHQINWENKSVNINELAKQLNIGRDSFIFIDDNPAECAEVSIGCPDVLGFNIPKSDEKITDILKNYWGFDQFLITEEDKKRTNMMVQNTKRSEYSQNFVDFEDFLKNINLEIEINEIEELEVARASQLTQKTNQFNSTTIRRTEEDINKLLNDGATIFTINVKDKFGSYGHVGLTISYPKQDALYCDSFILSCRVLGKRVENAMTLALAKKADKSGFKSVIFKYKKSVRNTPLVKYFNSLHSSLLEAEEGEIRFDPKLLRTKVENLKVDYSDVYSEKDSNNEKQHFVDHTKLSIHLQEIALCAGDVENIFSWLKSKMLKSKGNKSNSQASSDSVSLNKLKNIWEEALLIEGISVDEDYFNLGGDSLIASKIVADIYKSFGVKLPLSILYSCSTITALSEHISGDPKRKSSFKHIVHLNRKVNLLDLPNCYLVPGMFGEVLAFNQFVSKAGDICNFYGLQARGIEDDEKPFESINEMANAYFNEIIQNQVKGPYHLVGYCSGGLIINEVAKKLLKSGKEVGVVLMISTNLPQKYSYSLSITEKLKIELIDIRRKGIKYLFSRAFLLSNKIIRRYLFSSAGSSDKEKSIEEYDQSLPYHVAQAYLQAETNYKLPRFEHKVTLILPEKSASYILGNGKKHFDENKCLITHFGGWEKYIDNLEVVRVSSTHDEMIRTPYVEKVLAELASSLRLQT